MVGFFSRLNDILTSLAEMPKHGFVCVTSFFFLNFVGVNNLEPIKFT